METNKEWEAYVAKAELLEALERLNSKEWNQEEYPDEICPSHYNHTIQPWEYMESVMTEDGFVGYLQGNVIKYISRFQDKGGREDLSKAKHYIDKLLSVY